MKENETKKWIELSGRVLVNSYARSPVAFVRGKGTRLWGADGKEYLDFLAGISVVGLGHCHPKVVAAIKKQAGTLLHTSNLYHIPQQAELAQKLVEASFADRAFFCNSGAEANEGAIKMARRWAHKRGKGGEVICMEGSFHGRTLATLSATGQSKYQQGFEPLPAGFPKVPFGDIEAVRKAITGQTAAVLVEPIQAEGGVRMPPAGYLKGLRKLCDSNEILLIYDEVQTGMGRTGTLFAYEQEDAPPDIMSLAKSLAGGVPIGCVLAKEECAQVLDPGSHASTFGGNPLACAAANAVMDVMTADGFLEGVRDRAAYMKEALGSLIPKLHGAKEIRGRGMLWGMELDGEASPFVKAALERGLLIGVAGPKVLRFAPPLVVTRKDIDLMAYTMEEVAEALS